MPSTEDALNFAELVNEAGAVRDQILEVVEAYYDYSTGTATGGPNGDGYYPMPVAGGGTVLVPSPAKLAVLAQQPWLQDLVFDAARSVPFRAPRAMTVALAGQIGTGTITVEKSTAAAPSVFNPTTFPFTIEEGGWMRITASAVENLVAAQIRQVG